MQLKVDNKVLTEESARLASHLAEVQHARGNITTVPVPGKPLWLLFWPSADGILTGQFSSAHRLPVPLKCSKTQT